MKRLIYLFSAVISIAGLLLVHSCAGVSQTEPGSGACERFSFVFLTDIHVQPELNAVQGFRETVKLVNGLEPDFVITGGDLIMDALAVPCERADSLYRIYQNLSGHFKVPVYNTIGNHEIFGWYEKSGIEPSHPRFGKGMYRERLGRTYYSFDYRGWHFIIIDSVARGEGGGYIGKVDTAQLEWIRGDLSEVDCGTPIAVSTHIPLVTVMPQLREGGMKGISASEVVINSREVLKLFEKHNLKLVLQGHLHLIEEIRVNGITFITAGAVSGRWWRGPRWGVEEGFAMIRIEGDSFSWEYIDTGWEAAEVD